MPGDVTPAQLAGVIADMAALAVRLDKPLTARLMPAPGKVAGDQVAWEFFSVGQGRVMPLRPHTPRPARHGPSGRARCCCYRGGTRNEE